MNLEIETKNGRVKPGDVMMRGLAKYVVVLIHLLKICPQELV